MADNGPTTVPRDSEFSDTLKLLVFVALGVAMMAVDKRTHWLDNIRNQMTAVAQPLWAVAGMPSAAARKVSTDAGTFTQLTEENERLRRELMLNRARMERAEAIVSSTAETARLAQSANAAGMAVTIASVLDVDLDPTRQRLVIRAGSRDGIRVGQTVMDEGGLVGQIISVQPNISTVLLITDPEHAVPVMLARNGVRMIASGKGRNSELDVINVPLATDIKVGDDVVTSGLGGRFAPGLPVGRITNVRADDSRAFLMGDIAPSARLNRGLHVMVVQSMPAAPPIQVAVTPGKTPAPTTPNAPGIDANAAAAQPLKRDPSIPQADTHPNDPNVAKNPVIEAQRRAAQSPVPVTPSSGGTPR